MKRLFKSKKAVSPVIATVLMIMVTMAGMTILFGFVTSYAQTYKEGAGSQVLELLTVEDIWITSSNTVQITVYNAGKIDSQITSVYVNGLALTDVDGKINLNVEPVDFGKHIEITLHTKQGISLSPSQTYTFTIGTKTGSTFETTNKP